MNVCVEGGDDGGGVVDVDGLRDMDMEVVVVVEDVGAQLVTQGGDGRVVVVMMGMAGVTHVTHRVEGVAVTLTLA
jgi:hypothetical protein